MKNHFRISFALILVMFFASAYRMKDHQLEFDKLDDFDKCIEKHYPEGDCLDALELWNESHPDDLFVSGKKVQAKLNSEWAVPYFFKASQKGKIDCKDAGVQKALMAGLNLAPDNSKVAQARELAFGICFQELKNTLAKESSVDSYLFKNACRQMAEKKLISGFKEAKCKALQSP